MVGAVEMAATPGLEKHNWTSALSGRGRRFAAVGVFNTAFAYAVFAGLVLVIGDSVHYLLILLISHVVSVVTAFSLHRRFVFEDTGPVLASLVRFWSVYLVALGVNIVALPVLVDGFGLSVILAQLFVLGSTAALSFVIHGSWTFKKPVVVEPDPAPYEEDRG